MQQRELVRVSGMMMMQLMILVLLMIMVGSCRGGGVVGEESTEKGD